MINSKVKTNDLNRTFFLLTLGKFDCWDKAYSLLLVFLNSENLWLSSPLWNYSVAMVTWCLL